jgi:hypothetical protein
MNLSLNEDTNEFKTAEDTIREAIVRWRTFELENVRKQADDAFLKGSKVKDKLRRSSGTNESRREAGVSPRQNFHLLFVANGDTAPIHLNHTVLLRP